MCLQLELSAESCNMDKVEALSKGLKSQHRLLIAIVIFCILLNILTVGMIGYEWTNSAKKHAHLVDIIDKLSIRVDDIEKASKKLY